VRALTAEQEAEAEQIRARMGGDWSERRRAHLEVYLAFRDQWREAVLALDSGAAVLTDAKKGSAVNPWFTVAERSAAAMTEALAEAERDGWSEPTVVQVAAVISALAQGLDLIAAARAAKVHPSTVRLWSEGRSPACAAFAQLLRVYQGGGATPPALAR
jgi:hypothetical protein